MDVSAAVAKAVAKNRGWSSKYSPKSLDQRIFEDSATTRMDRLATVCVDDADEQDAQIAVLRRLGRINSAIRPCSILYDVTRLRLLAEDGIGWPSSLNITPDRMPRL